MSQLIFFDSGTYSIQLICFWVAQLAAAIGCNIGSLVIAMGIAIRLGEVANYQIKKSSCNKLKGRFTLQRRWFLLRTNKLCDRSAWYHTWLKNPINLSYARDSLNGWLIAQSFQCPSLMRYKSELPTDNRGCFNVTPETWSCNYQGTVWHYVVHDRLQLPCNSI